MPSKADELKDLVDEADKIRGVGDVVAAVTKKLGIRECDKCKERRRKLNERFPIERSK